MERPGTLGGMADDPLMRPWRTLDAPALLRHVRSAPDVARELPEVRDVGAARALLADWVARDGRGEGWHLALVHNGVAVGAVSVSAVHREFEFGWLGYWTSPQARGRGWTKRAAATLARHVLHDDPRPLHRLESGCRVDNHASERILRAVGFTPEGVERQKLRHGGQRFDALRFARLRTDPEPALDPLVLELG